MVHISDVRPRRALLAVDEVSFGVNATSSYPNPKFHWDFGDGDSEDTAGMAVGHIFSHPGNFRVRVTLNDEHGGTASDETEFSPTPLTGSYSGRYGSDMLSVQITQNGIELEGSISGGVFDAHAITGRLPGDLNVMIDVEISELDEVRCTRHFVGTLDANLDSVSVTGKDCDVGGMTLSLQKR